MKIKLKYFEYCREDEEIRSYSQKIIYSDTCTKFQIIRRDVIDYEDKSVLPFDYWLVLYDN